MFLINHRIGRTRDYTLDLFESDGVTGVTLAAEDVVRLKVGRGATEPTLDISSAPGEELPGGSRITFTVGTNDCVVRISQEDVEDLESGAYDAEVSVVDNSDGDAIKHAEDGVVMLHPVPLGDVSDEDSSSSSESSASS